MRVWLKAVARRQEVRSSTSLVQSAESAGVDAAWLLLPASLEGSSSGALADTLLTQRSCRLSRTTIRIARHSSRCLRAGSGMPTARSSCTACPPALHESLLPPCWCSCMPPSLVTFVWSAERMMVCLCRQVLMRAVLWIEPAVAILQHKKRGYLQQPAQVRQTDAVALRGSVRQHSTEHCPRYSIQHSLRSALMTPKKRMPMARAASSRIGETNDVVSSPHSLPQSGHGYVSQAHCDL